MWVLERKRGAFSPRSYEFARRRDGEMLPAASLALPAWKFCNHAPEKMVISTVPMSQQLTLSRLRRKPFKYRQFVRALHPADALGGLDVHHRRNDVGIVVGAALDIDDPGHRMRIDVDEAGTAIGAKVPPAMF